MRFWTEDEARAYLPRVRQLLGVIRGVATGAAKSSSNGHGPIGAADAVQASLDELAAGDIILRDATSGLIDFHARGTDGVVYFLCWKDTDDDLAWWHLPEDGFAGRKPLPRDSS